MQVFNCLTFYVWPSNRVLPHAFLMSCIVMKPLMLGAVSIMCSFPLVQNEMPSRADCKLFLCYRTARGDNNGTALSFVTSDDHKLLSKAEQELTKECTGAWECSDSLQQHVMISLYIIKKMQNRTTQGLPLAIFLAIFLLSRNLFYRCERILTRRFSV